MRRRRTIFILAAAVLVPAALVLGPNAWAYLHYRAAERALARRQAADADRHAARCLKVWPWGTDTHLLAARAAAMAGDFDRAERHLHDCRQLGGNDAVVDLEFKLLSARRGDLRRSEKYLVGLVLQGHPDSPRILEVLTRAYYATFQLAHALECVKRWIEQEPDEVETWWWRARVYEKYLNRPETVVSYRRVVELDPADDDARLALASLLATSHQPQEALAHLEVLRPRLGETAAVLIATARCRRELNQPDEARAILEQLIAREPGNAQFLAERGRLALDSESAAEAESWFRKAAALMPFEKDINYSYYQCLEQLGKQAEAREVLARLRRVEADLDRINDLAREIARAPHDPAPRCEAGQILIRNGQGAEGVRWLLSALSEDPGYAAAHEALADYYQRAGDREQADKHRRLAGNTLFPAGAAKATP